MAAPTARLLRPASAVLRTSSLSSQSLLHLRVPSPSVTCGRVVCPPLIRSLAFFFSSTAESVDSEDGAVVNVSPATNDVTPPAGRFANVEMKKGDWICSKCNYSTSTTTATTRHKFQTPRSPCRPPWILLSRTPVEECSELVKFLSIRDNTICPVTLPRGLRYSCCLGSSPFGHVVLLDKNSYTPIILDPTTGYTSTLPTIDRLPSMPNKPGVGSCGEEVDCFRSPLKKVVGLNSVFYESEVALKGTVVSDKGLYFGKTIVVKEMTTPSYIAVGIYGRNRNLAIARAGAKRWEALRTQEQMFQDVIYYKGWFYGVNGQGLVEAIEPNARKTELLTAPKMRQEPGKRYLVESGGDLFLINRLIGRIPIEMQKDGNGYSTQAFEVFKMDLIGQRWIEMESLGDRVLFVGGNHSLSVMASECSDLKGDHIYFLDDYWEHNLWFDSTKLEDYGVFDIMDKRIQPLGVFDQCSCSPAPIWVIPPASDFDSLQLPESQQELLYLWGVRDDLRPPWLLLPRSKEDEAKGICRLYSLQDKEEFNAHLPLEVRWSCCLGASSGWIVTVNSMFMPHLTNPLTGFQIPLPPINNLLHMEYSHKPKPCLNHNQNCITANGDLYFGKCVVSWNSTSNSSPSPLHPAKDYVVVAIQGQQQQLACARQGDWSWSLTRTTHSGFEDVIHHNGVFFAVCVTDGHVFVESLQLNGTIPDIAVEILGPKTEQCPERHYIVESLGSLLLVVRLYHKIDYHIPQTLKDEPRIQSDCNYDNNTIYKTTGFKVYKLSLGEQKWYEAKCLGDRSLILGGNHSVSVSVSDYPGLRGNVIYFTDDFVGKYEHYHHRPGPHVDTGVFLLEDGRSPNLVNKILGLFFRSGVPSTDQCNFMNFARNIRCLQCKLEAPGKDDFDNGGLKSGDWSCPQCNFMNYAHNARCLECKADRPYNLIKRGDWTCPKCKFLNFARNTFCLRCSVEKSVTYDNLIVRQGDWNCPKCQFMNFARNTECRACHEPRSTKLLRPGDWECPSCKFLNFKRNSSCLKCKCDQPSIGASQTEDHTRKRIVLAAGRSLTSISDLSNDITNLLDENDKSKSKAITGSPLNSIEEDNNDDNYDKLMTLLTEDGRESKNNDSSA